MKKRILASLLALCLMGGMLPPAVLAAEPDTTMSTTEQKLEKNDEEPANHAPSAPANAGVEEDSLEPVLADAGEGEAPTSGTCGENATWEFDPTSGILTIRGSGEITSKPWISSSTNYSQLINHVIVEEGISKIGNYIFLNTPNLSSANLPTSLKSMGEGAFMDCTKLTTISLPTGIETIEPWTFSGCESLEQINLPSSVSSIEKHAFSSSGLVEISLPNNVSLNEYAFSNCDNLVSVIIPENVISIAPRVFINCPKLTSAGPIGGAYAIQFGWNSIIPETAFMDCDALQSIYIPNRITSIGKSAFCNCKNLKEVFIPGSVQEIADYAFDSCSNLEKAYIADGVQSIGNYAFEGCENLQNVYIPDSVHIISSTAFQYCKLTTAGPIGGDYDYEFGWTQEIPKNAFANCAKLTNITLPSGIQHIGEGAFYYCQSIDYISIPDGVINIGNRAFYASNLSSIKIPNSVTSIGSDVFYGCNNLEDIYYAGSKGEWDAISGIEDTDFTNITIHYNYTGSGGGATTPEGRSTSIKYLTNWNADTQTASFAGDTDYSVNDNTDMSFAENIDTLLNRYVLVESVAIDGSSMQFLSIQPVDSALGTCTAQTETEITIDGISYPWESGFSLDESSPVLYHTLNGKLVGVNFLRKEVSTDLHWDSTKNELSSNMRSYPTNYMTDMKTVNEYKAYCEEHSIVETTVYYADFGSYQPLMMVYGAEQGYYGNTTEVDKSSPKYIINQSWNEWYDAYEGYISAIKQALEQAQDEDVDRAASIEAQAEAMKEADSKTYDKILTFDAGMPEEWKLYCYQALCSTLMEAVESEKDLDLSSINLKNPSSAEVEIIKKIAESLSTCKEQFKFEGVTILVEYSGLMGAYSGRIICESTTSNERYVVGLTSRLSDCEKIVTDYLEQLKELEYKALNNLYTGISKDLLGKPLNKLTESYLNTVISKYEATLDQLHLGNVHKVLVSCYNYYQQYTELYNKISQLKLTEEDLKGIKECLTIGDDTVTDKTTKKAVEVLGKAQNNLTTILSEYVATGSVTPPKKGWPDMIVSMFKCPVSVAVYKADQQIGFVGDDELWYDEEVIYAEERGGAKIIYSQWKDNISFIITGTDEGTMSYTVEEYQDGSPTGRLNFNDISVKKEQKFTATLQSSLSLTEETKDQFLLTTGNIEIQADEYISVNENASVSIQAKASDSKMGIVWGDGSYVRGDAVVLYAVPENDYLFMGWYDETNTLVSISNTYEFSAQNDICLTALFMEAPNSEDEKQVYTITFNANGGTVNTMSMDTDSDGVLSELPVATRDGYTFVGWFTDQIGGIKVTTSTTFGQNTVLYAHWNPNYSGGEDSGNSDGSSSNDGNGPSQTISIPIRVTGGSVKVTPTSAQKGTRVRITVNPDSGYELNKIVVLDKNGKELTLTQQDENTYTFIMPDGRVSIDAHFVRVEMPSTSCGFYDVAQSAWYYNAVQYVAQRDLMTGVSDAQFAPNAILSRAQVVQILYVLAGRPAVSAFTDFADVNCGDWYADAVAWAAANGVVSGVSEGMFGPNDPLTREQLALILYRYAQMAGYNTTQGGIAVREFTDYTSISSWALEAVQWAVNAGLISSTGNRMLSPNGTATRAQVAQIFMNFCQDNAIA